MQKEPRILQRYAKTDLKMIYISTDYVSTERVKDHGELDDERHPSKCIWTDEIRRRTCGRKVSGEIFYCSYCMGIRREWKELYQDNAEAFRNS